MKKKLLLGILIFITFIGNAATITVTTTNDSGAGSLRQALLDANNGDTINFSVTGVIMISSPLDISKDIIIEGPGADVLAIDGNNSTIVFRDQNYAINTVEISGLEIRNGSSGAYGAGIQGFGYNLTVKYCNIHSNTLSAGYGAAISVWSVGSSLTIENSTLHDNTSSGYGTCIYISEGGDLNISNSTIYNNNGSFSGQAIYVEGSAISLTNVTIAGHTTGSSAIDIHDYEDFMSPANNKAASVTMVNCIIDNSINNYSFFSMMGGTETSLGYNISNDNTMASMLIQSSDLNNTSSLLDPNGLENNGGTTPTISLESGSPAIDAGTLIFPLDQIGSIRYGSSPDVGALEYNPTLGIIENGFGKDFVVYPNPTDGTFSIDLGSSFENFSISITDMNGKLINTTSVTNSQTLNMNLKEPAGIYIVSIIAKNKKAVIKLIKQ